MSEHEALIHIRSLIKAREQEGSGQEVAATSWHLISEDRYNVQLHDQIRLTLTERGWVPVIVGKDGSLVGWVPTSANTFKTPEEALTDLRKHHDL